MRAKNSLAIYAPAAGIPSVVVDLPEPQDLEVVQTFTQSTQALLERLQSRLTVLMRAGLP